MTSEIPPRSFVRRHLFWLLAVVVVLLGGAGFLWWRARSQRPKYVTATVTRGTIQRSVGMTGALNPVVTVQVGSYVSGTLKTLRCDYNTEVVVGQVCATIDPVPFQLIVDQDQAEVKVGEAQLNKDRAALLYAKTAYERDAKLVAEGTVSQDTVDSEKSTMDQTIATIALDQANVANKVAILKAAKVNLAYTNIVSPVVGTVITRSIDVGQTVAASLQSPTLFLIGKDLTKMQVDTNVSEADVGAVHEGQDAVFTVQAYPGRTFHGKVTTIRHGPITVQNVVTYDVVIAVDNPDRALFPGMTADTHIVIAEHDNVLRVPIPASRFNPAGTAGGPREDQPGADAGRSQARGEGGARPEGSGRPRGDGSRVDEGQPQTQTEGGRSARAGAVGAERGNRPGGAGPGRGAGRGRWGGGRLAGGRGRRARLWVLNDDGTLRPVDVVTGIDDGQMIEVFGKDLKVGDKVVVNEVSTTEQPRPGGPGSGANPGLRPGQGQGQGFGGPRL